MLWNILAKPVVLAVTCYRCLSALLACLALLLDRGRCLCTWLRSWLLQWSRPLAYLTLLLSWDYLIDAYLAWAGAHVCYHLWIPFFSIGRLRLAWFHSLLGLRVPTVIAHADSQTAGLLGFSHGLSWCRALIDEWPPTCVALIASLIIVCLLEPLIVQYFLISLQLPQLL